MRITATIRRTDQPSTDPADTIDEEAGDEWTIERLAHGLRCRYGPTVVARVEFGPETYVVTGSCIARKRAENP